MSNALVSVFSLSPSDIPVRSDWGHQRGWPGLVMSVADFLWPCSIPLVLYLEYFIPLLVIIKMDRNLIINVLPATIVVWLHSYIVIDII